MVSKLSFLMKSILYLLGLFTPPFYFVEGSRLAAGAGLGWPTVFLGMLFLVTLALFMLEFLLMYSKGYHFQCGNETALASTLAFSMTFQKKRPTISSDCRTRKKLLVKIIEGQSMLTRQGQFDNTGASFFRSPSQLASRVDNSKLMTLQKSYLSFVTDLDHREEDAKPDLQIPEHIFAIVSKKHNERTSSENSTILRYLIRKGIFRFLIERLSLDVVKNMIKQGNVKIYANGEFFVYEGKRIKTVDILLIGEAVIISQEEKPEPEETEEPKDMDLGSNLDLLIEKLGKETKKFKLKGHSFSKKVPLQLQKSTVFRKQTVNDDINIDQCQKILPQNFLDFQPLFQYQPKHSRTVAAKGVVAVFTVPLQIFYQSLLHNYHSKLNQKLKIFRKIPIFQPFENSKLKTLIEKLTLVEMKKNQMVYRQGQEPNCFYMLVGGQVEISKTIDIFSQNPNNFYKNRVQLSRERTNRQLGILPYANFNGVYNYTPQQKMITLAQINPICIFGEEEILDRKPRQVNAKVLSLTAQLYEIHLEDIQDLCNRMIGSNGQKKMTLIDFLQMMQESVTLKKILFRQNQLSDLVHYQNKNKYSTLFENTKRKSKSFRKSIPHAKMTIDDGQSRKSTRRSVQKFSDEAPPQFNNFNFTDFLNDGSQEFSQQVSQQLNEEEMKVVKLTHVKFSDPNPLKSKEKSIRLRSFSKELASRSKLTLDSSATADSLSNKITLDQPLFTINYFQKQQRAQKRLYVQAKKKRLQNIYKNSPQKSTRY